MCTGGECQQRYRSSPGTLDEHWQISPTRQPPCLTAAFQLLGGGGVMLLCFVCRFAAVEPLLLSLIVKSHTDLCYYSIYLIKTLPPSAVIEVIAGTNSVHLHTGKNSSKLHLKMNSVISVHDRNRWYIIWNQSLSSVSVHKRHLSLHQLRRLCGLMQTWWNGIEVCRFRGILTSMLSILQPRRSWFLWTQKTHIV